LPFQIEKTNQVILQTKKDTIAMHKKIIIQTIIFLLLFISFKNIDAQTEPVVDTKTEKVADSIFSSTLISMEEETEILDDTIVFTPTPGYLIPDDPIAAMLDSMNRQKYLDAFSFTSEKKILNTSYNDMDIPVFNDSILALRIDQLNQTTPMELTYNAVVARYIELYANRKRALTAKMLGLSKIYFPMFEEMLDKYDVPLEMKYLAIVESALNPTATSRAGAKGLWQFMYNTGKLYGLEVSSIMDDRSDPYKATDAACRHLKDLYLQYHNWELALAAYNCGAGNVNKAIRRSGGKTNYWQLWPYLPTETRGYVPAFIAVVYVMNYATEHNIYPVEPGIFAYDIDTVMVKQSLTFDQISEKLGIPYDLITFLNPAYKKGIIPASSEKRFPLQLPYQYMGLFIMNEDSIYTYKTKNKIEQEQLLSELKFLESQEMKHHKVKKGETIPSIAAKYRCSVANLRSWNGLTAKSKLKLGQQLVIYSSPISRNTVATTKQTNATKHTVQQGETLGGIAQQYNCAVSNLKTWNNLSDDVINIGQVLQVVNPEKQTQNSVAVSNNATSTNQTHKVKEGDTLWSIAKKYPGVTPETIKSLNGLKTNNLTIGQTLKIPL
jgi:membrane-bound lytic murein transglycosylase D